MNDDLAFRALRLLQSNPHLTQRKLARELGISLGKTNYCLRALIEKGWVKVQNFAHNPNKRAYAYLLTPQGIEQKARLTGSFLVRKRAEYEALAAELAQLAAEASQATSAAAASAPEEDVVERHKDG